MALARLTLTSWRPSFHVTGTVLTLKRCHNVTIAGTSDQIYASVVSTLLALMDGVGDRGQVVVIGATNR